MTSDAILTNDERFRARALLATAPIFEAPDHLASLDTHGALLVCVLRASAQIFLVANGLH